MQEKARTRTVSFRVPEHILADIEKEAKTQLVSTNSLRRWIDFIKQS